MDDFDKELDEVLLDHKHTSKNSLKKAIRQAVMKHIVGEDDSEDSTPYHDYTLVSKENLRVTHAFGANKLRAEQRQKLKGDS